MTQEITTGSWIGHYRVVSRIGAGGMGDVYLAEDSKLRRKAALKILPTEFASDDERMNRFVREARAASALNHPNIITIYEIGETDGMHFIATEFIEGETLHDRIGGQPLAIDTALDVAVQVGSALDAAHRAGIVHRDIKPENIMLRPDGIVKVLDFGVAKLTESDVATGGTTPGMVIGTPNYMSPEQACGVEIDARSDIFSFGCVLYEMLGGRRAFTGESPMKIISSVLRDEPPALSNADEEAAGIVKRAMEKALDQRYQTTGDLLADLRRLKQRRERDDAERSLTPSEQEASTAIFAGDSVPSRTASLPPNNLTTELQPLIGREGEIAEIRTLLQQPDVRLITITGVGGTGKTRLSEAVARDALPDFPDGVYWVDLAAIDDPGLLTATIGQALGLREEKGATADDVLREHLCERRMLLVLDNFEQISPAAPRIGELLSVSQNLKVIVTSRNRLRLRSETEFTLEPLEVPMGGNLSIYEVGEFPAVELFVKRARATKPAFALTADNAETVVEICRKLDGLPLAIELAAARVKLLPPQAILTRLSNSLGLLRGGAQDSPERQQTMHAAIAWSYDLLDENERSLLARLAVFSGGFTFEAAEAVANAGHAVSGDILDGLSSLIDKSLLLQREMADGEPWFRMLVVVREFALNALESSGYAQEVKAKHAEFYTGLAEEFGNAFDGPDSGRWLTRFDLEHDNLLSTLEWALAYQPQLALKIVGDVRSFWIRRGYLTEGSKWMKAAIDKCDEGADALERAKAYCALADSVWMQGDAENAERYYEQSLRLARQADDKYYTSTALRGLGYIRRAHGDLGGAKKLIEESLAIARELNDARLISLRLNSLGELARLQRDHETARKYYEEALEIARKLSAPYLIAIFTVNLSTVTCLLGDVAASRSYANETLTENEALDDKMGIADALSLFAALAVETGDLSKAGALFGASQGIADSVNYIPEPLDQDFVDHYLGKARQSIGNEDLEAALTQGRTMKIRDAIALARSGPQT